MAFFDDQPQAKKAAERMKARYNYKVVLAETVGRERYEEMLRTGA